MSRRCVEPEETVFNGTRRGGSLKIQKREEKEKRRMR